MIKTLKKTFWLVVSILVVGNLFLILSGNTHLYKGIANTYLKGRSGPSIDEYHIFSNREIKTASPQPWAISTKYNTSSILEKELEEMESLQTVAYLVIKDDSILHEQYWEDYSDSSHSNSFSMAKSIVSILIGVAIKEGKIKSIHQAVADFLPQFKDNKLSIEHLLNMSSGINFDESYANPFGFAAKAYYGDNLKELLGEYKVTEEPGKVFKYKSGNTLLLAQILKQATGKNISDYASEKLWKPIGAEHPAYWSLDDVDGMEKAYCCFNSNARDFARLGKLYLQQGKWNEEQIVNQDYVEHSIQLADLLEEDGTPNQRYGLSWWLVDYKDNNIFYARGIIGQYIIVIPSHNIIVVRLGHKRANEATWTKHPSDLFVYIDAALEME